MHYWLWLRDRSGQRRVRSDSVLPGTVPDRVMELLTADFADSMGLCRECPLACRCHVIETDSGNKFCTILFHDTVRPSWHVQDVA